MIRLTRQNRSKKIYINVVSINHEEIKEIYWIKESKFKKINLQFNLGMLKLTRPLLPPFFRLIAPARWANQRIKNKPNLSFKDKAKF